MITAAYAQTMARYNRWQNQQLADCMAPLPDAALTQDRGAFFGSILGTLCHLWWGDGMWLSRFGAGDPPGGGIDHSTDLFSSRSDWQVARAKMDARIMAWADGLLDADLAGDLTWYSAAAEAEFTQPVAPLVVHVFNHQTHHRGQVHKMLTEAGVKAPVSDLPFLPEVP
ncbi:MAG: DinB family protein [Marinibacterium sp.]|nr:DinB family protein [Marinibacterium sp.]